MARQVGQSGWGVWRGLGVLVWAAVIVVPLGWLILSLRAGQLSMLSGLSVGRYARLWGRSIGIGATVATLSLLAAWPAGRVVGASAWGRRWGAMGLVLALLIPPQVIYYAWGLLFLPTSRLGAWIAGRAGLAETVSWVRTIMSLGCWYWPLAALLLGLGWRRTDPDVWSQAKIEAGAFRRWVSVGLPMLSEAMVAAWVLVFVLAAGQFSVCHLAMIDTIGTELSTVYQMTGSVYAVAWASLPWVVPVGAAVLAVHRFVRQGGQHFDVQGDERIGRSAWVSAGVLWAISTLLPLGILVGHVESWAAVRRFAALSWDGLLYSGAIALVAGVLATAMGLGTLGGSKAVTWSVRVTTFLAALLPGALVASAMAVTYNRGVLSDWIYQRFWMVSLGHAGRLGVLAVLVIGWVWSSLPKTVGELARLDGADGWRAAYYVYLPGLWPGLAAGAVLTASLSMTELSATLVLLPAGVPNFAQQFLNQMHYARDQHVIVSCLFLVAFMAGVTGVVFALVRLGMGRALAMVVLAGYVMLVGCDKSGSTGDVSVVTVFGQRGRGECQFVYPRALAVAGDGTMFVIDKAARVQHLSARGEFLNGWSMPAFKTGKPVGVSCDNRGRVYVADTHYHRVMVYDADGTELARFGEYGTELGQFIYPTDIAVAPDGRLLVSEYGGNDRVTIFSPGYEPLGSFGSLGEGVGQFSRPSALAIDARRGVLYVADACNHRIVRYDLSGKRLGAFGSAGTGEGQLRYPYDVNVLDDGTLIVCEYGNNRVQRFDAEGRSLGVYGRRGRGAGELLNPWAAAGVGGNVAVLDSGNDRVQVFEIR